VHHAVEKVREFLADFFFDVMGKMGLMG